MTDQRGRPTAVFDFDGTILDTRAIRYLVAGPGKKDYRAFYGRTLECPPNYEVVRAAQQHHAMGHAVIILSGRAHEWSAITLQAANRLSTSATCGNLSLTVCHPYVHLEPVRSLERSAALLALQR